MKISVLGAGGWGTTLGILLHYNGHQVTLWEYQKSYVKELIKNVLTLFIFLALPYLKKLLLHTILMSQFIKKI